VAAGLALFDESLGLQEADKLAGVNLWHPGHPGTPTVSSST
jgi:hypothetical protein